MTFRELFLNENRAETKKAFLTHSYDEEDIQALMKKGKVYIQYKEPKSRSGLSGGNVKFISKEGVTIDSKFGGTKEVPFDSISLATNV